METIGRVDLILFAYSASSSVEPHEGARRDVQDRNQNKMRKGAPSLELKQAELSFRCREIEAKPCPALVGRFEN
jgi:hypothetical protein